VLNENDDDLDQRHGGKDREITLGTTMVLGIFFALAVLCSAFFGFGYTMGRHSSISVAATAAPVASQTFSGFKPAPGSPVGAQSSGVKPANGTITVSDAPPADGPSALLPKTSAAGGRTAGIDVAAAGPRSTMPPAVLSTTGLPVAATAAAPIRVAPAAVASAAVAPAAAATPQPGAMTAVVQIAAVSHQEDAEMLATTLKRKGYSVGIRNEPQDKLLHVQIGPFPSKKEAEAMRLKLQADGFNAIVK